MKRFACVAFLVMVAARASEAATCESLTSLSQPTTTVTVAHTVEAGAFTPPGRGGRGSAAFASLPSFCRVAVTLKPTPQSDIKAEIWLPSAGWNGTLQVVGNGAWAGSISYPAMATAVAAGYAAASTDTGHVGGAENATRHKDVLIDFAHRAVHETTATAKKVINSLYGAAPKLSYFNGCSTGGRQALTAAQRYPDDFDGIIAGDPAIHGLDLALGQIGYSQAMTTSPASAISRDTLTLMHKAVIDACDANDGAKDGVLENPQACRFDPKALACKAGAAAETGAACLTPAQVEAAQKVYGGARNSKGQALFPGLEPGSEGGWTPTPVGYAVDVYKYVVFKDASWNPNSLDVEQHDSLKTQDEAKLLDASNPDLSPFFRSNGKLLMYHGWSDPGIPARASVNYYEAARAKTGRTASESLRLFMVPGMGHCGGGDGVTTFDFVTELDRWVTTGKAPETIPASRVQAGKVERTRPLCAYPKFAVYKGTGDMNDAASFECRTSK